MFRNVLSGERGEVGTALWSHVRVVVGDPPPWRGPLTRGGSPEEGGGVTVTGLMRDCSGCSAFTLTKRTCFPWPEENALALGL